MRLRFSWPGLRTDVTTRANGCAHCLSYNVWRNQKQELHFSWPVIMPLYIMQANLWDPGTSLSKNSAGRHLLNAMCDLTQFFVSTITMETHAEYIAKPFTGNIIISLGMVANLVIDADSWFKSVFRDICASLEINYWPLVCGNNKGKSISKYHQFFNKT